MAYNKNFNPDALPAHAEPDQAAAALSGLRLDSKPAPRPQPVHPTSSRPSQPQTGGRRNSPAALAAQQSYQQSYRPPPAQSNQSYHSNNSGAVHSHNHIRQNLNSPPPPSDYGYGPRPQPQQIDTRHNSHSANYQLPPRTPAPPDPDSAELYPLFQVANVSRTGSLTTSELGSALVNGDFTPFDPLTIKSLMRMFSSSPPNAPEGLTITYVEFQNLWRFLAAWRALFERFDEDRSGRISRDEFTNALVSFGYRLSQPFVDLLYRTYNGGGQWAGGRHAQGMSFDLFVQACVSLKRMTEAFKTYDDDRDGYVTLSFEEFLSEILKLQNS